MLVLPIAGHKGDTISNQLPSFMVQKRILMHIRNVILLATREV